MSTALLCLSLAVSAPPGYRLEVTPTKHIEAVLAQEFHMAEGHPTEWVFAAPRPPELLSQKDIKAEMAVIGHQVDHSIPHHALIIGRVPVKGTLTLKVELKYQALLRTVKLVPLEPGAKHPEAPPLSEEERKEWLKPTDGLEFEAKPFQEWLTHHKLRREAKESDLEFAQRAFMFIATHFKYHYEEKMDRKPAAVARAGQSDCGGIADLYVSTLRANGIPARTLAGRWAKSSDPKDKVGGLPFYQTHVKTEFFAHGIGWVPVDPTGGVGQGAKVDDFYFGREGGDFLTFSLPVEHTFEVPGLGKQKFSGGQGVGYWLVGKASPKVKETEDWKVVAKPVGPEKK